MRTPFRMIEEILQSLDRPDEPFNIHLELRVAGSLEERALLAAVGAAVATHPMARARKVARRILLRPAQWEIGEATAASVLWSIDCDSELALATARAEFMSQPIGLEHSPGLRLLLAHRPGGDSLLLAANHAVTDGIGALRFLHSVARAYSGRPDPVSAVDPLTARDLEAQFGRSVSGRLGDAGRAQEATGPRSFLVAEGLDREPGYGFVFAVLSVDQRLRMNPRRIVPTATTNDLLLASLHRAIAAWNADHGRPPRTISTLMPVNLRPEDWRSEVVANLTLGAPVLTTPAQRSTAESLFETVTAQTRRIKSGDDFAALVAKPLWVRKLLLSLLLCGGVRSTDAAVLSNLGRIDDVPDFGADAGPVSEFWFSPPVAMPTGLAVGAAGVNGQLRLVIRYRRALFDDRAARRFAELFLGSVAELTTGESEELSPAPKVRRPLDGDPERQTARTS